MRRATKATRQEWWIRQGRALLRDFARRELEVARNSYGDTWKESDAEGFNLYQGTRALLKVRP